MVYVSEDIYAFDLAAALAAISGQRREQALRFRFELGQRQCVLAYQLLARALREEYGVTELPTFHYGEHGKPLLVGHPEIHFSLSHCRVAVACAVDRQPVGIDVESVREYSPQLARYTMSDAELAEIGRAPDAAVAFTRLWTRKEALLKLTGEGLRNDMKTVLDAADRYRFTTVERPGYVYTLCEQQEPTTI